MSERALSATELDEIRARARNGTIRSDHVYALLGEVDRLARFCTEQADNMEELTQLAMGA